MNKIESYFLQQNKIKFSNVVCNSHSKKIILRNPAKTIKKQSGKDINIMKEIKDEELKKIYSEVEKCMKCEALCNSRLNVVFGRGNEKPDIVFVGEAPGADEDKQGLPFVGRGGKLLDKWINQLNIDKEPYYIMNALKCRPPENRDPLPEEKKNCRDFFVNQLKILNPKIICALGRHGFGNLIDFDLKIISNYKELKDGDTINFGRFSLHVIHTPGHSPGSICFYEKTNKILFCGDTLYDGLIDVRDKCSNQTQYLHSLEKLAKLNVKLFVGSHEEPIIQKDEINVNNLVHFYKELLLNKSSGKYFSGQKYIEFWL